MFSPIVRNACTAALLLAVGGCAFLRPSGPQQIEVHARLDGRDVRGIGCVLANDAGRWVVVAPGRVTVARSAEALRVHCLRQAIGSGEEQAEAPAERARLAGTAWVPVAGNAYPAVIDVDVQVFTAAGPASAAGSTVF